MGSQLDEVRDWAILYSNEQDPHHCRIARRLGGAVFPFELPRIDSLDLLDQARRQPNARILHQKPGPQLDAKADAAEYIRSLPIERAAAEPHLHLSLFTLDALTVPGGVLHQLKRDVFDPLEALWKDQGLVWKRLLPVLFITGSASATNYHFDLDTTIPLHLFGEKRFHSLKRPDYWCPKSLRAELTASAKWPVKPEGITPDESLVYDNRPGDAIWIPTETPHWVDAGSFSATLTFALRDLHFAPRPVLVG